MTRALGFTLPLLALALAGCPKSQTTPDAPPPAEEAPASQPAAEPAPPPPANTPEPAAAGKPCRATDECADGLKCTTADGACDRPPGCGPDDVCVKVCYGVCVAATADAPGTCASDKDCRAFSNYCGGCACDALHVDDPDPKCKEGLVSCVVSPCQFKVAKCLEGQCVLRERHDKP